MSPAETAVRRIVDQYSRPQPASASPFLTSLANLPVDRHDVVGALFIAREAFEASDLDDPWRETLGRVLEFERSDKRYDAHHMNGILTLCREGIAAIENAPAAGGPRP